MRSCTETASESLLQQLIVSVPSRSTCIEVCDAIIGSSRKKRLGQKVVLAVIALASSHGILSDYSRQLSEYKELHMFFSQVSESAVSREDILFSRHKFEVISPRVYSCRSIWSSDLTRQRRRPCPTREEHFIELSPLTCQGLPLFCDVVSQLDVALYRIVNVKRSKRKFNFVASCSSHGFCACFSFELWMCSDEIET